jgi:hypothetical protein
MAKPIIGNASAITVPRQDLDNIRRFVCDVFGGKIEKEDNEKDIFRLEEEFFIYFATEMSLMRANSCGRQEHLGCKIKSDNVEGNDAEDSRFRC